MPSDDDDDAPRPELLTSRRAEPRQSLTAVQSPNYFQRRLNRRRLIMSFTLPSLPFSTNALAARGMCQETLELHHGKHHQAYVAALNNLVEKNPALKGKTLEQLVALAHKDAALQPVFNNAGQHWNHCVFWESLSTQGGRMPSALEKKVIADFGSVAKYQEEFKAASAGQFGSGWVWLVLGHDGKLKITKSSNASSPLATGEGRVLLTLDVWEHAYYVDFRNRRADFCENFLSKLADYERAAQKLAEPAQGRQSAA
jgi:superoxide dismutase, Fe-Mn family